MKKHVRPFAASLLTVIAAIAIGACGSSSSSSSSTSSAAASSSATSTAAASSSSSAGLGGQGEPQRRHDAAHQGTTGLGEHLRLSSVRARLDPML